MRGIMSEKNQNSPKKKLNITEKPSSGKGSGRKSLPAAKGTSGTSGNVPATQRRSGSSSQKKSPASSKKSHYVAPSEKIVHQIVPYVWYVFALFLLVCFLTRDAFGLAGDRNILGKVGEWLYRFLTGMFGVGAYLFVPAAVYFGILWKKLVDRRIPITKKLNLSLTGALIMSGCLILLSSMLFEVIFDGINRVDDFPGFVELFNLHGLNVAAGGGVIGGSLGWLCYLGLKPVGSIILLIPIMIVLVIFLCGLTPNNVANMIKARHKLNAERRREADRLRREAEAERADEYRRKQLEFDGDDTDDVAKDRDTGKKHRGFIHITKRVSEEPDVSDTQDVFDDVIKNAEDESGEEISDIRDEQTDDKAEPDHGSEIKDLDPDNFTLDNVFNSEEDKKPTDEELAAGQVMADDEDDFFFAGGATTDETPEEEGDDIPDEPEKPSYNPPPIDLLIEDKTSKADLSESIAETKKKLRDTLESFDIGVKDIGYSIGPTITRYEVVPEAGVRVRAISNLVDDIAMNLATVGVRIEAPIPNKPAVGVEVPNAVQAIVHLRSLIDTDAFRNASPLTVALGQDVAGKNVYFDIKKMPHMIIAGTTGSGKSVCINCIVCSLLYKNPPDKVKLIMIDPKKVEFSIYQHIPHLYCPIISDPRKAAGALASAVAEMERRYTIIEDVGVREIDAYNKMTANDPDREYLPKLIIVIDELADLMMMAKNDVEQFITRIAQKARAVGIHLIIGTQRPSVDVITGLIKANVPSRIACTVKSQVDSRTIIDIAGAEKLIGHGDMLFSPVGLSKPMRVQGAFLEDKEVADVVDYIKENNDPVEYNSAFMDSMEAAAANVGEKKIGGAALDAADMNDDGSDVKFRQAVEIAVNEGKISTSLLQRKLSIGYGKAAKIIDQMYEMGYVSEADGNKPRRILITKQEFYEKVVNDDMSFGGDQ